MNTHTPGPWTIDHQGQIITRDRTGPCSHEIVAHMPAWFVAKAGAHTTQSNARLIAAAPELLAALQELRSYADLKLQGHRQDYPEDHCMVQTALRMLQIADAAIAKATK